MDPGSLNILNSENELIGWDVYERLCIRLWWLSETLSILVLA